MSESFESVMEEMREKVASPYWTNMADRLKTAHEHELEQTRKSRFHEGYLAGQRSMDAEHYAVSLRLRALPLDGDTTENLSQIARAVWHSDFGWTEGACRALRDELVRLLGGVSERQHTTSIYDVLGNERYKAVCRLREWEPDEDGMPHRELWEAVMGEKLPTVPPKGDAELDIIMRDRLIHLLGGDEPTAMEYIQRIASEHGRKCLDMELSGAELNQASVDAMSRRADQSHESSPMRLENETGITTEFRAAIETATKTYEGSWYEMNDIDHTICHITEGELLGIADRMEEQFARVCELWERTATDTAQGVHDDMQAECNKLQAECDRLTAALDELHADPANDAICRLERERDELRERLDRVTDALMEEKDTYANGRKA